MTAPVVASSAYWTSTSSNAPQFDWPTSPAPAAGDCAIVWVQSKTAAPASPAIPGFTLLRGPTGNGNGNASQSMWKRDCDGTETGTVTGSAFNTGQQDVIVVVAANAKVDVHNLTVNANSANTSHSPSDTSTTGADRLVLSCLGGRFSTTQTGQNFMTPPTGYTMVLERNVAQAGTNNEDLGVAYKAQASSGSTAQSNWSTGGIGMFSVASVVALQVNHTSLSGAAAGSSTTSGTLAASSLKTATFDGLIRTGYQIPFTSVPGGLNARPLMLLPGAGVLPIRSDLIATLLRSSALLASGQIVTAGQLSAVKAILSTLAGATTTSATLLATLQRGYAIFFSGAVATDGEMDAMLFGDRPGDLPPVRFVDDTHHLSDHEMFRQTLVWLVGQLDSVPVDTPTVVEPTRWG